MDAITPSQPKFKDVWNQIQSDMGEKHKEIKPHKKTLDKDDFLKIMITQMKNQDPTKPFDAEKLASEVAQISTVEQLHNLNSNFEKAAAKNRPIEQLSMTNLIGKNITVDRNRFLHNSGSKETLSFNLPEQAEKVKITLRSESGEVVMEKELGQKNAGLNSIVWDGLKDGSLPAASGMYQLSVEAKGEADRPIKTSTQIQAKVVGLNFQGEEPMFLIGDASKQEKVALNQIIRIEEANPVTEAVKALIAEDGAPSMPKNFIPLQATQQNKMVADAKKSEPSIVQADLAPSRVEQPADQKNGFPNGLTELQGGSHE